MLRIHDFLARQVPPKMQERLGYIKQMYHVKERFENLSEEAKQARQVSIKADEGVYKLSSLLSSKAANAYKFDMRVKMHKDLNDKRGYEGPHIPLSIREVFTASYV